MTGFSLSQEELVQWNCVENSLQKISISITLLKIVVLLRCLLHYHKSFCSIAKHFKSHVNYLLLFGKFRDARDPIDMTKLVCSTILDLNQPVLELCTSLLEIRAKKQVVERFQRLKKLTDWRCVICYVCLVSG